MVLKLKPLELSFDFEDRDQKKQRKVNVKLPLAPIGGRVGAKPRMSTAKKRTGTPS